MQATKILPAHTTLAVCCNCPTSDNISHLVALFFPSHSATVDCSCVSFSTATSLQIVKYRVLGLPRFPRLEGCQ